MTEQTGILPAGFVYGEQAWGIPSPIPQLQSPHSVLISQETFTCNTHFTEARRDYLDSFVASVTFPTSSTVPLHLFAWKEMPS